MDKNTCIIHEVNTKWGHNKDALYASKHLPTSAKGKTTALANCNTFSGTATMSIPQDER